MPQISVIVPVYRAEKFLHSAKIEDVVQLSWRKLKELSVIILSDSIRRFTERNRMVR